MRPTLERLWQAAAPGSARFVTAERSLPASARLYLDHALAPETVLANAVRLQMHGEIKLKGWSPFTAEQVILPERGMIWSARTRMKSLPVSGSDRLIDGYGRSRWRLLGLIPVVDAEGPDVARSVAGRMAAELVWLPSFLSRDAVEWRETASLTVEAKVVLFGFETDLVLTLSPGGAVRTMVFQRWGNPNGLPFGLYPFGGVVEEEKAFGGNTIPRTLRVGWHFGTDRYEREGEFFRVSIDGAAFR